MLVCMCNNIVYIIYAINIFPLESLLLYYCLFGALLYFLIYDGVPILLTMASLIPNMADAAKC